MSGRPRSRSTTSTAGQLSTSRPVATLEVSYPASFRPRTSCVVIATSSSAMSTLAGPSPPCSGPSAETPDTVTGSLARVLDHARPPEYGDSGPRIDSCGLLGRSEQDSPRFLGTG